MKHRDAIRALLDVGYVETNKSGGKHRKFTHVGANHWVTVPYSPKGDTYYGEMVKSIRTAIEKGRQHNGNANTRSG